MRRDCAGRGPRAISAFPTWNLLAEMAEDPAGHPRHGFRHHGMLGAFQDYQGLENILALGYPVARMAPVRVKEPDVPFYMRPTSSDWRCRGETESPLHRTGQARPGPLLRRRASSPCPNKSAKKTRPACDILAAEGAFVCTLKGCAARFAATSDGTGRRPEADRPLKPAGPPPHVPAAGAPLTSSPRLQNCAESARGPARWRTG